MDDLIEQFKTSYGRRDGKRAGATFEPILDDVNRLWAIYRSSTPTSIKTVCRDRLDSLVQAGKMDDKEADGWAAAWVAYWNVVEQLLKLQDSSFRPRRDADGSVVKLYASWKDLAGLLCRSFSDGLFPFWAIPCLYAIARFLPLFGAAADRAANADADPGAGALPGRVESDDQPSRNRHMEEAAWQLNRLFSICISDRRPADESLKWGAYYMANLLFKTYFRLNSLLLTKNIVRTIETARNSDFPPLDRFPKSDQVTYLYFTGLVNFLNEKYSEAETSLAEAEELCHRKSTKNKELILQYLIPCRILTTQTVPTAALLKPHPRLKKLLHPIICAIRAGNLSAFDSLILENEVELCQRRIYLAVDRAREIVIRNLFRKVFLAGGFEPDPSDGDGERPKVRRTRVPIEEFVAALKMNLPERQAEMVSRDDAECALANLIYKERIKGYISREAGKVVFSKANAFPGTGI